MEDVLSGLVGQCVPTTTACRGLCGTSCNHCNKKRDWNHIHKYHLKTGVLRIIRFHRVNFAPLIVCSSTTESPQAFCGLYVIYTHCTCLLYFIYFCFFITECHTCIITNTRTAKWIHFLVHRLNCQILRLSTGLENLYGMLAYCEDMKTCRRALIGRHFGERWNPTECHEMCDNCKRTGDQSDGNVPSVLLQFFKSDTLITVLVNLPWLLVNLSV